MKANSFLLEKGKTVYENESKEYNEKFTLLKAFGIFTVVLYHTGAFALPIVDNFQLFAGFHMALFVFISGYFYNPTSENNLKSSLIKLVKRLLVPYFLWNFIYGIFDTILVRNSVISYGDGINFSALFIRPWIDGHQYGFNIASWFLLTLFLISVFMLLLRSLLTKLHIFNEILFFVFTLVIGSVAIYLRQTTLTAYGWMAIVRPVYLLAYYQFGRIYKLYIEKIKISNITYFAILFILQAFIYSRHPGVNQVFAYFTGSFWSIYAMGIIDILIFSKISEILSPAMKNMKVVSYIGKNTFSIMMHHPFYLFLINISLIFISEFSYISNFDKTAFMNSMWYCCDFITPLFRIVYLVAGLLLPCLVKYIYDKMLKQYYLKRSLI